MRGKVKGVRVIENGVTVAKCSRDEYDREQGVFAVSCLPRVDTRWANRKLEDWANSTSARR